MTPQPNWKEKFVEETMNKFESEGRIIAQLPSERLADECGSRLAQLIVGVRIALQEAIILAERHAQKKVYADLSRPAGARRNRKGSSPTSRTSSIS